jgi:hypothetical protein
MSHVNKMCIHKKKEKRKNRMANEIPRFQFKIFVMTNENPSIIFNSFLYILQVKPISEPKKELKQIPFIKQIPLSNLFFPL